jgi:competence protein ComEC
MKNINTVKRLASVLAVITLVSTCLIGCTFFREDGNGDVMSVHFIDVGQGDCELVVSPSGENMLIDAGKTDAGDDVVSYISSLGISCIDVFVASHYHEDHIGGSHDVFEAFDVESVLILDCEVTTSCARKLLEDIEKEKCDVVYARRGYEFDLGDASVLTMSPEKISDKGGNNDSIVLRVEYESSRYLFTGDAEEAVERDMLDFYSKKELSCDLLKLGHHGSRTSSSQEFLDVCAPNIAVISCGEGNSYGHPHRETVEKMKKTVKNLYRTDIDGNIVIITDGHKFYLESTQKSA